MKSHSGIMTNEIVRRVTNGFTPTAAVHQDAISLSTVYSSTGYFYLTNSFNADCTNPAASYGFPVNTCIVSDSFTFKVQLIDGALISPAKHILSPFLTRTFTCRFMHGRGGGVFPGHAVHHQRRHGERSVGCGHRPHLPGNGHAGGHQRPQQRQGVLSTALHHSPGAAAHHGHWSWSVRVSIHLLHTFH